MDHETYMLAKACTSAVFSSLMNAYVHRDDEQACRRFEHHADRLENKFKNQTGFHPHAYIELYEKNYGNP